MQSDRAKFRESDWNDFALKSMGFKGVLTFDSRHAMFYCSGRRTGLVRGLTGGCFFVCLTVSLSLRTSLSLFITHTHTPWWH